MGSILIAGDDPGVHFGVAWLTNGTANVPWPRTTMSTLIFLTPQQDGVGTVCIDARRPGIGFRIKSTDPTDGRAVAWLASRT